MSNLLISYFKYIYFLPIFIESIFISLLLTPIIGSIARKFKVYDLPPSERKDSTAKRRIHDSAKLKLGGVSVIIPFLILIFIYIKINIDLVVFAIGIIILFIGGIIDDIYDLSAKIQFMIQVLAVLIITFAGIDINYVSKPLGGIFSLNKIPFEFLGVHLYFVSLFLTIIWVLIIINAVKWMAGSDGLAEGNISIIAMIIALLSIRFQTFNTAFMGFIFAGLMIGFLFYNFYPSKIFSGASGKSVYGFIIAVLSIYSGAKLASTLMVLAIPIIDLVWVIISRIIEDRPKSLLSLININDKRHLHHRLLDLGFSQKKVALIEYSFTFILGLIALIITGFHKAIILAFIIIFIFIVVVSITHISNKNKSKVLNN
jgi:UDP-GlcNAc:undecaprenyl-phosphate GlcNAc-1-phosphate transferase